MAKLDVLNPGSFSSVRVHLAQGEQFISESGMMVRSTANIDTDVTARPKGKGGLLGAFKRLLGGDSFFMSTYTPSHGDGDVVIAPTLPGDCYVIDLDGGTPWMCAGGSYMGSGPDVALDTQFQGLKGFFSGESLFYVELSGRGPAIVNAFGRIREIEVDGALIVDTGHVVAFQKSLSYTITKAGSSWFTSWLAGEGFVMNFTGRGRLLVQSHNPTEFGKAVGPLLPPRQA
ncbi:MAG: TIGR00266 family protein [Planctomycetota bacterium]